MDTPIQISHAKLESTSFVIDSFWSLSTLENAERHAESQFDADEVMGGTGSRALSLEANADEQISCSSCVINALGMCRSWYEAL